MKVTLFKIYASRTAIDKLIHLHGINARVSYKIAKTVKPLQSEIAEIDRLRVDLIKQYGEEDPATAGNYQIKDDTKYAAFVTEMNQLLETEVEIEADKIELKFIAETTDLTPDDFSLLDYLIQE